MNVQQLVERLQEFPADYPVYLEHFGGTIGSAPPWLDSEVSVERVNVEGAVAVVLS